MLSLKGLLSSMRESMVSQQECLGMTRRGAAISDRAALGYRVRNGDMRGRLGSRKSTIASVQSIESMSLSGCAMGEARGMRGMRRKVVGSATVGDPLSKHGESVGVWGLSYDRL